MARVEVTRTSPVGPHPASVAADALDIAWTAAEANGTPANENYFVSTGPQMLLVRNTHATTAYTFTLNSAPIKGREEDVTDYSLAAGEQAAFYLEKPLGWRQSDGNVNLEANNAAIEFAVLDLQ
ncbi:MAG: hypothetical protein DWQ07_14160 [Chloroflexi bacterium]|nr:MAG: hypothetical protein DWQ07_14160 [Chloroflexota bacterium]